MVYGGETRFIRGRNLDIGLVARGVGIAFALATMPALLAFGAIQEMKNKDSRNPVAESKVSTSANAAPAVPTPK